MITKNRIILVAVSESGLLTKWLLFGGENDDPMDLGLHYFQTWRTNMGHFSDFHEKHQRRPTWNTWTIHKKNCLWNPTMKPFWFLRNPEWCVILSTLSKISSSSCTVAASSPGGPRAGSPQLHLHVGLSENSVPLHPMVNDHYPY